MNPQISQDMRQHYRKSFAKPPGVLSNFGHYMERVKERRGGLIREEGLFTKSDDKDIYTAHKAFQLIFCGFNTLFYVLKA